MILTLLPFKVSPLEKLTFIFASSFLTFSNLPLFYPYNIFAVYFSSNSSLIKSLFSTIFNFSCYLTSVFILFSNFATTFFAFSRSFFFSYVLYSAVNSFHHTKYFVTLLIFLFDIFSTFHSLTLSISISFTSSTFYPPACSLYYTI